MKERNEMEEIRRSLYKKYLVLARENYKLSEPGKNAPFIGEDRKGKLIASILFTSFALESFINEIAIEKCSEYWESLEKIKTIDKFVFVPKLVLGKAIFTKSVEPYQSMKKLIEYRNLFVHYKPEFRVSARKEERLYNELNFTEVSKLYTESIRAIKKLNGVLSLDYDWLIEYSENIEG